MDKTPDLFRQWWHYHEGDVDIPFFDVATLNLIGMEAFRFGFSGKLYLLDRDGPEGGIWDFISAAHRAGVAAGEASRNEWDWEPSD